MDTTVFSALPQVPPAVASFLRQIADPGSSGESLSFTYASKIILKATAWPEESFLPFLAGDLAKPHNVRLLEQEQSKLIDNNFSPFYCPTFGGLKPPPFRRQLQHFFFFTFGSYDAYGNTWSARPSSEIS
jgi:hypothetical protein